MYVENVVRAIKHILLGHPAGKFKLKYTWPTIFAKRENIKNTAQVFLYLYCYESLYYTSTIVVHIWLSVAGNTISYRSNYSNRKYSEKVEVIKRLIPLGKGFSFSITFSKQLQVHNMTAISITAILFCTHRVPVMLRKFLDGTSLLPIEEKKIKDKVRTTAGSTLKNKVVRP